MTVILCILDGLGLADPSPGNAVHMARTPTLDRLKSSVPYTTLKASGRAVGLPMGQIGNSEVGHLTIGTGRTIEQTLPKANKLFGDKTSLTKKLLPFLQGLTNNTCHIFGLLSSGGVHGHVSHLNQAVEFCLEHDITPIVHGFLDGRDALPRQTLADLDPYPLLVAHLQTVNGRYYALDRDENWSRIDKAYQTIVYGDAPTFTDIHAFMPAQYADGQTEEFIFPHKKPNYHGVCDGDGLLFLNFRADRARQLWGKFITKKLSPADHYMSLVDYGLDQTTSVLLPADPINHTLAACLAAHNKTQLHIAETEKYAHVTYFFNGRSNTLKKGEDHCLIPSPAVASFDLKPKMSASKITNNVIKALRHNTYDFIVINYANPDMVGHTGDLTATIKAVEMVDTCVERLLTYNPCLLLTADHGNAEYMIHKGQRHTAHTNNLVPCFLVGAPKGIALRQNGSLADLAPTVLDLLGLSPPKAMTGKTLLD
jgi:2,3-bisphosphoglycerate-independent phosphoglycerate mutase